MLETSNQLPFKNLESLRLPPIFPPVTRPQIELSIKIFIVALIIAFIYAIYRVIDLIWVI